VPEGEEAKPAVLQAFRQWLDGLPRERDLPDMGTVAVTLVLLENLASEFDLSPEAHRTSGGWQLRGAGGPATRRILARYGETRPFLAEGGRTSRGAADKAVSLLPVLEPLGLERLSDQQRREVIEALQQELVGKVRAFHAGKRLEPVYDPSATTLANIEQLLALAAETGKAGAVAQHLVGAKLEVRFPEAGIERHRAAAADVPTGRAGDFEFGDTTFHVTLAPNEAVVEKCRRNLERGRRVYLLVPGSRIQAAAQLVENAGVVSRVSVRGIEGFVAQNLDEIASFSQSGQSVGLRQLFEAYNARANVENDPALLIEIPDNL
jgi:hypothetical protein